MTPHRTRGQAAQRGYTLVELMISILIALFLMAGLVTLVMHTRNTSTVQNQMQQLQENERIAMTVIANVIQQAGYFPDPLTNAIGGKNSAGQTNLSGTETESVNGQGFTWAAGQGVSGFSITAAPGDMVAARFTAPKADASGIVTNTIINCAGTTNTDTASIHTFTNVFFIDNVNGTPYLKCVLLTDGAGPVTVNLVPGLYDMQVLYGVATGSWTASTTGPPTPYNVTQYVTAAWLAANPTKWTNVSSVKIRLYFQVPNYGFSGGQTNSQAASAAMSNGTQYVERVIGINGRIGVYT